MYEEVLSKNAFTVSQGARGDTTGGEGVGQTAEPPYNIGCYHTPWTERAHEGGARKGCGQYSRAVILCECDHVSISPRTTTHRCTHTYALSGLIITIAITFQFLFVFFILFPVSDGSAPPPMFLFIPMRTDTLHTWLY